jgi:hypothetical protein
MSMRQKKNLIKNNDQNKTLTKNEINELNDIEFRKKNNVFNSHFERCYYCINYSFSFLYKTIKIFIRISGVYLLWIFLHFCASYLYTKLCVPNTLLGLLMSPFLTATPHCQGLRWVIYNGANIINNMWLIVGTWLCANIMGLNNDSPPDN